MHELHDRTVYRFRSKIRVSEQTQHNWMPLSLYFYLLFHLHIFDFKATPSTPSISFHAITVTVVIYLPGAPSLVYHNQNEMWDCVDSWKIMRKPLLHHIYTFHSIGLVTGVASTYIAYRYQQIPLLTPIPQHTVNVMWEASLCPRIVKRKHWIVWKRKSPASGGLIRDGNRAFRFLRCFPYLVIELLRGYKHMCEISKASLDV